MHLDTKQFLDLVAETSGIELEKVEQQLQELIKEIRQAVSDQEAYEIEGFGIFSGIGNRIMFIPSKELETEINFKYVGMEPIELEGNFIEKEPEGDSSNPFSGLQNDEGLTKSSAFEGLIEDLDELEQEIEEKAQQAEEEQDEAPGPDEWGVEAHKEDESADRLFASLMGQEYEAPLKEEDGIQESEEFDQFGDVFGEEESESETVADSSNDLQSELSTLMGADGAEAETVSEDFLNAGLEDDIDDPFAELEDLVDDTIAEEETVAELEAPEVQEEEEDSDLEETEVASEEEITEPIEEPETTEEEPEDDLENALLEQLEEDVDDADFDDPFEALDEEPTSEVEEMIPVITNLSSRPKKEEAVEETITEEKSDKKDKKEKKKKNKGNQQPAPTWLWVIVILVFAGASVFAVGYFNIVTIPFITPEQATVTTPIQQPITTQNTTPPVTENTTPPSAPTPQPETAPIMEETPQSDQSETNTQEQEVVSEVVEQQDVPQQNFDGDVKYGLMGSPSEAGNDGYTIVMYSLSNQQNAINQHQRLLEDGYRALITPIESEQYGTLYRISIGQFASLFDAAVSAEEILDVIPENYFIKKIN